MESAGEMNESQLHVDLLLERSFGSSSVMSITNKALVVLIIFMTTLGDTIGYSATELLLCLLKKGKSGKQAQQELEILLPATPSGPSLGDFVP
jgi:hypothetical protein